MILTLIFSDIETQIISQKMETRYLNVDLLIESDSDLSALLKYWEGHIVVLWNEMEGNLNTIGIEADRFDSCGPEEDILKLLNLIETLPPYLQHLWAECRKKVMDIGFECGTTHETLDSTISTETVQKIALSGCAINIRIYPYVARPENPEDIIIVNEESLSSP